MGGKALATQHIWWILLNISPARSGCGTHHKRGSRLALSTLRPSVLPYGARPASPCSAGRNHWPLATTPAAMRASSCRRCGEALASASPGRRVSQSLVPSWTPSRGCARTHSSACGQRSIGSPQPARSMPPVPSRQQDRACWRVALAAAPRPSKVPEHGHHRESPGHLCVRHQLPSKPSPGAGVR